MSKTAAQTSSILILILAFILGGIASHNNWKIMKIFSPVVQLFQVPYHVFVGIDKYNLEIRWHEQRNSHAGVITKKTDKIYGDFTAYSNTQDHVLRLINHEGEVIYKWDIPYDQLWTEQSHILHPKKLTNDYFYIRDFHIFANGDVVIMFNVAGVTPWGAGIAKINKDGQTIWTYTKPAYNDFEVGENENIYALYHNIRYNQLSLAPEIQTPLLEDTIVTLSKEGEFIDKFSIFNAFKNSNFANFFDNLYDDQSGDLTHTNSIEYIAKDSATVPWLKKGHLIVSIRNADMLAVINPKTKSVTWAEWLPFRKQHDIDYLDNGNFLIFDNRAQLGKGGYSRVVEFNPQTFEKTWTYTGTPALPFKTEEWGSQQRLKNGNTVIIEAEAGRIFEVTQDNEVVWNYYTPLRHKKNSELIPVISSLQRFEKNYLTFLNNN